MLFDYFVYTIFGLSALNGACKGATNEAISLLFGLFGLSSGIILYKPSIQRTLFSTLIFSMIYVYGLHLGNKLKSGGIFQIMLGMVFGVLKFFVLLIVLTTIALLFDVVPESFVQNLFMQCILPCAKILKNFILNYLK